ncbi:MAG TPA: glycosyltransferase family 1 protein [Bryobacteraceae bacterium]
MQIALDATYSVDPHPSGIAVYSREILSGLASAYPQDDFFHCYRAKQWKRGRKEAPRPAFPNVRRRLLLPPLPTFRTPLFHALNQRVDRRPARFVVSTFHDLFVMTGDYSSPAFRARFTEQALAAARNSDFIIAVSSFTAKQVADLLHYDRSRIEVIPHGVRLPPVVSTERENMILSVGALQLRKNVVRLVEAFERLPGSWRLVLAGAPTGYGASAILERIAASPARERISVTGYVSTSGLERLYGRASIFAFPSLDEGFGIPVLEAMAHGVPVLTSNRSALAETAGDAALLVDPFEADEIHAALARLTGDPDLREKLSAQSRTHAAQFSWENAVCATYKIYERLLG